MRLPRDLSGDDLAKALTLFGYEPTRQTGSHVRLTTTLEGEHHVTIPSHRALPATLHGSPRRTGDADVCPAADPDNLRRLADALRDLGARLRAPDVPEGLPFACDATFLSRVEILNLSTPYGDLDICFRPAGFSGYEDLAHQAVEYDLEGLLIPTADLADVIRSKEAAGRPKDLHALPTPRALLAQFRKRTGNTEQGEMG